MAESTSTHSVEAWLGITDAKRPRPKARRRNEIGLVTLDLLRTHAPEIAALQPDASWSHEQQQQMAAAIASLSDATDRRDVHNATAHVVACGEFAGLWKHAPWPLRSVVSLLPSRVSRKELPWARQAAARRKNLAARLPEILASEDRALLRGALLVSAADFSGLIEQALLLQLLDSTLEPQASHGLMWVDMRLGDPIRPWRTVRRVFLDEPSQLLLIRAREIESRTSPGAVAEKLALQAANCLIGNKKDPLSLRGVIRSARAWWGLHLPAALHDYSVRTVIAPSLPPTAWRRLISGQPLPRGKSPAPARSLRDLNNDEIDDPNRNQQNDPREATPLRVSSHDGFAHATACTELMKALRQNGLEKKLNARRLRERLAVWESRHSQVDGWVQLLHSWVVDTLYSRKRGPFGRGDGPRAPGVLRYLEGFADRFVAIHWRNPPGDQFDLDAWNEGLEILRAQLAELRSASVAKTGLFHFLCHVESFGVPPVIFGDSWQSLSSPSEADANVFTPREFRHLREWLRIACGHAPDSYPALRLQAMAIIAFRMGARWEELQTLRLCDLVLTDELTPRGSVWIRPNDYQHGKVREARRTLSLEHFLTQEERQLVARFAQLANTLGGVVRPGSDVLFADPGALASPPDPASTHDVIQSGMRVVSGDLSLVFHHLRHSAATFAFLRLLVDESIYPEALAWIPDWAIVSTHSLVGPNTSYASALIGRGSDDPSRIFAVSEMLGHLDPESSLLSYVHLMDLMLYYTTRELVPLPTHVSATLDGVLPASIRRRRHRARHAVHAGDTSC